MSNINPVSPPENESAKMDDRPLNREEYEVLVQGYEEVAARTRFEDMNLGPDLMNAITYMNYKRPSKIQATVLPLLLKDPPINLLCQSQTGTGKTAAFVINILRRVDPDLKEPQALIIAPTRELARQIVGYTNTMLQFSQAIETALAIPGSFKRGGNIQGHIIVGTPGTTLDCIRRGTFAAEHIKILVFDEGDNLLDQQGLGEQAFRVKKLLPQTCQTLLFSATFNKEVLQYADRLAPNMVKLTLEHHELTVKAVKQIYMDCQSEEDKYRVVVDLYHTMTVGASIIFVRRRDTANELAARMEGDGHKVAVLHSALDNVSERDRIIDLFRNGLAKVLITTNVLARGIDVINTSLVINYDLPLLYGGVPDTETYLHRIGRTGRFGRQGLSISFVTDRESWEQLREIQRHFGVPINLVPGDNIDVIEEWVKRIVKSNQVLGKEMGALGLEQSRHAPQ